MATLRIYSDIAEEDLKGWLFSSNGVSFQDVQHFLDSIPEEDETIDIRLHCCGGSCIEGWAIYDALRQSGKTISATVEGECSSMASVILLAAPKERRYAYENSRMLIHNPSIDYIDPGFGAARNTPDVLEKVVGALSVQAQGLREEQKRIIDLYVERTGSERDTLQALMDKETYINASTMLELGFIGTILAPTTASTKVKTKTNTVINMAKEPKKQSAFMRFLAKAGFLRPTCQVITTPQGEEFTVEREDGDPQVGDIAYPDGTFTLEDGTQIVISYGKIAEINTPAPAVEEIADVADLFEDATLDELTDLRAELDAAIAEKQQSPDPEPVPVDINAQAAQPVPQGEATDPAPADKQDAPAPVAEADPAPVAQAEAQPKPTDAADEPAPVAASDNNENKPTDIAPAPADAPAPVDIAGAETDPEPVPAPADEEKDKLLAEKDATITDLNSQIEELTAQVEALQQQIAEKDAVIAEKDATLEKWAPIVEQVEGAGGVEWLTSVLSMRSTFNPSNRRFVSQKAPAVDTKETKTQRALREKREAAQAKRAKR